jgi:pimeloyl-ACP methyl ester carboxylesterase
MIPPPSSALHPEIEERAFAASHDGSRQTYLRARYGGRGPSAGRAPLLLVWLHGARSHQDQGITAGIYANLFGRLAAWMASREVTYLCPEYRGNSWMGPAAESDLLDVLRIEKALAPPSRTLLLGGSMGATSALIFAGRHPGQTHGVFALCPATDPAAMHPRFPADFESSYGGPPSTHAAPYRERAAMGMLDALARLPIFLAHGSADAVIPVEHSRRLAAALAARRAPCRYVELAGGDHDAPVTVDIADALGFLLASTGHAALDPCRGNGDKTPNPTLAP